MELNIWNDVPKWQNRDQNVIKKHFKSAKATQVYVEHQSAIEVIDWSSEKYCPQEITNHEQVTNKLLIGLNDGTIKMLQYDTQVTKKRVESFSKLAEYKSHEDGHTDKIYSVKWIRLEIGQNEVFG